MSSFDGVDIFGSGNTPKCPHEIIIDGEEVAKKRAAFAGVDGVESQVIGGRGRPIRITGTLVSASSVQLMVADIEEAIRDWGPCTLIDGYGGSWTNVELDGITLQDRMIYTGTWYVQDYIVTGRQLYT